MNLEKMSFKNYTWSYNPKQITVEEEKNIAEFLLPFKGNILQNLGRKRRIIKGLGEFFGENCIEEFNKLRNLFLDDQSGYLKLPEMDPFLAKFSYLQMVGDALENIVTYRFEFLEEINMYQRQDISGRGYYHVVIDGENLWTIANKYGVSVSDILALNEDIRRPEDVTQGQRVRIK